MSPVPLIPVIAATFAGFIFGALWYSPLLFLKSWCRESGISEDNKPDNPATLYGMTFAFTFVGAYALALMMPAHATYIDGAKFGAIAAIGLIATSLAINYQFAQRSWKLWLIDAGFHIGRFIIIGMVLAVARMPH